MRPSTTNAFDDAASVGDLRTASARLDAARAVNSELLGVCSGIGPANREKQAAKGWGEGVLELP
jgi:hypothetical protein